MGIVVGVVVVVVVAVVCNIIDVGLAGGVDVVVGAPQVSLFPS